MEIISAFMAILSFTFCGTMLIVSILVLLYKRYYKNLSVSENVIKVCGYIKAGKFTGRVNNCLIDDVIKIHYHDGWEGSGQVDLVFSGKYISINPKEQNLIRDAITEYRRTESYRSKSNFENHKIN